MGDTRDKAERAAVAAFCAQQDTGRTDIDDCIAAAIDAYEAALWRPISEHDGSDTEVDVFIPSQASGRRYVIPAFFAPDGHGVKKWHIAADGDWLADELQPTHFRPRPLPPEGV